MYTFHFQDFINVIIYLQHYGNCCRNHHARVEIDRTILTNAQLVDLMTAVGLVYRI